MLRSRPWTRARFRRQEQAAILAWYGAHGRSLAFRATTDPYAVLVSEVMAQQTQISRVEEAWAQFLATFPTIRTLAEATPADVLRAWRGLGYNRRGLNLWRAARVVVDEHGGELPRDVAALERLPGVGPYTARAVAAIAFGMPVGAVDTNVRRVLGRLVAGSRDAVQGRELQALADASVPAGRVGRVDPRADGPRRNDLPRPDPALRGLSVQAGCRYAATGGVREEARQAPAREAPFRRRPAGCAAGSSTHSGTGVAGSTSMTGSASTSALPSRWRSRTSLPTASSNGRRRHAPGSPPVATGAASG